MTLESRMYEPNEMYGAVRSLGATTYTGALIAQSTLAVTGALTGAAGVKSSSPALASGLGYATGAGGTATQTTNRSTGVSVSPDPSLCGTITTDTTSLAAGASAIFTITNSGVAVGDVVLVSQRSGSSNVAGTAGVTIVEVVTVAAGSFKIAIHNGSTTTAETGAIIINYLVLKAVAA